MNTRRLFHVSALLCALSLSGAALALDAPKERPILAVSGKIAEPQA